LVQLIGVGVVGVVIWLRWDPTFRQFIDVDNEFNFVYSAAYVTLCLGVVLASLGALGLCGALNHNVCILATVCAGRGEDITFGGVGGWA